MPPQVPGGRMAWALAAALAGMAASTVQQTLLATATPTIVGDLGHPALFGWVSGLYLLASTATLPVAGVVTDRVGARPMYLMGMSLFGAGTVGAVCAGSMAELLAHRLVQGLGAGLLVPAALAVVGFLDDAATRGRAFAAMGVVQVLATVTGPIAGGWFTDHASWRGLAGWQCGLGATLPLVVLGLGLGAASMPTRPAAERWWRIRTSDLVLPRPGSGLGVWGAMAFIAGGLTVAVVTYLPWTLAQIHHMNATQIGPHLLPVALSSAVGSALGGTLASHRRVLLACWVVLLAAAALATLGAPWAIVSASAMAGLGCGAVAPIALTRVQDTAHTEQLAARSALIQLARHSGAAALVPAIGLWTWALPPSHAALAILTSLTLAATGGLVLARSTP